MSDHSGKLQGESSMATYSFILCDSLFLLYIVRFTIFYIEVDLLKAYQIGIVSLALVAIS